MSDALGRILIVDDETPVVEVLSEYFTSQGYKVETAPNGADALNAVRHERPDLVLLDIRMPGMDGVEVLRRLRDLDSSIAVIMVTANEDVALARETLKIGAFDYVAKPFDFRYLDRAVAAGLLQAETPMAFGTAPTDNDDDPWRRLAVRIFRAVRGMTLQGRAATGERLENAVLAGARDASNGHPGGAVQHLNEVALLVGIAADLGDIRMTARSEIEAALAAVRKAL
ncbi:MAG: response regulator [Candidatus Rokubacteria bacterium]|nr:response regulator [Candidatus Rokubacteria bacterium]MBI3827577.1 response regulator [Candidatus Rokubacteria bacterium]